MANTSIYAAFERMWQHIVSKYATKEYVGTIPDESEASTIAQYIVEQIESIGIDNYTSLDQTSSIEENLIFVNEKLDLVEDGAEKNIIEAISVNNIELVPNENKLINISVPTGGLANKDMISEEDLDSALVAKVNEKADFSVLADIATTGNVKDLVQTSGHLLILNCGTASINI